MKKLKTKKAAKKRFKLTKKKVKHHKAGKGHILTKKKNKRKRNLRRTASLSGDNVKMIRRVLPYG
ncbi:MAG: 50S ribosomal protein L35 [Candidatus Gygaella obscura]|nr:50S ribosomal protein L35 [Candidatus Gygaella obscura]